MVVRLPLALVLAAAAQLGCGRCPTMEAQTHVLSPATDAGIPEAGTSPPLAECRRLCGDDAEDPNDPNVPHPTSCRILVGDAGQPLVACDEGAYEVCGPGN